MKIKICVTKEVATLESFVSTANNILYIMILLIDKGYTYRKMNL